MLETLRDELVSREAQLRKERRSHLLRVAELEDRVAEERHQRQVAELRCGKELEDRVAECSRLQEETSRRLGLLREKQGEVEAVVPGLRRRLDAAKADFEGDGGFVIRGFFL